MSTFYKSTRGGEHHVPFEAAIMKGLAEDGGLFVPEQVPTIAREALPTYDPTSTDNRQWFQTLAFTIIRPYVAATEVTDEELRTILALSFGAQVFRHGDVTPLVSVAVPSSQAHGASSHTSQLYILELFHGPTFAFKDVAMQFLGHLFSLFLRKRSDAPSSDASHAWINVLGATSGDTGSAAVHGLADKPGVRVFMLHPYKRVSPLQERQMTTVLASNIHNIALLESSFDTCQNLVKELFEDLPFRQQYHLAAVNSINWARILVQIVYYFAAQLQLAAKLGRAWNELRTRFAVPTGNFGNVLAGYYARRMGLPIERLVIGCNENDILHRLFSSGCYHREGVTPTISPSMDIEISSNLERYFYYLADEDPARVKRWMNDFKASGKLTLTPEELARAQQDFGSGRASQEQTKATIKAFYEQSHYLMDPHTAVGVHSALEYAQQHQAAEEPEATICLATAHAAKFGDAIQDSISTAIELPAELASLEHQETRLRIANASADELRAILREHSGLE